MEIPLFPLSTIVMPDGILPLRLFEPRYIDMVKNCFKTSSGFGVCLIKQGLEGSGPAQPYPIGTTVSIIDFDQGQDGLLHITAKGESEFLVHTHAANKDGLIMAEVELLPEPEAIEMKPEYAELAEKLDIILDYVESNIQYPEKKLQDANWVCHRFMELLPISGPMKFELQQMRSNADRLDFLISLKIEFGDHKRRI